MSNECFQILSIYGDTEEINRFKTLVETPRCEFDIEKIAPISEESDRYHTWGTASLPQDLLIYNQSDRVLSYTFHTAWSPMIGALEVGSLLFPQLTFNLIYQDPLMDAGGIFFRKNDETLLQFSGTIRELNDILGNEEDGIDIQMIGDLSELDEMIDGGEDNEP